MGVGEVVFAGALAGDLGEGAFFVASFFASGFAEAFFSAAALRALRAAEGEYQSPDSFTETFEEDFDAAAGTGFFFRGGSALRAGAGFRAGAEAGLAGFFADVEEDGFGVFFMGIPLALQAAPGGAARGWIIGGTKGTERRESVPQAPFPVNRRNKKSE